MLWSKYWPVRRSTNDDEMIVQSKYLPTSIFALSRGNSRAWLHGLQFWQARRRSSFKPKDLKIAEEVEERGGANILIHADSSAHTWAWSLDVKLLSGSSARFLGSNIPLRTRHKVQTCKEAFSGNQYFRGLLYWDLENRKCIYICMHIINKKMIFEHF